jgi:hypothetical protein
MGNSRNKQFISFKLQSILSDEISCCPSCPIPSESEAYFVQHIHPVIYYPPITLG